MFLICFCFFFSLLFAREIERIWSKFHFKNGKKRRKKTTLFKRRREFLWFRKKNRNKSKNCWHKTLDISMKEYKNQSEKKRNERTWLQKYCLLISVSEFCLSLWDCVIKASAAVSFREVKRQTRIIIISNIKWIKSHCSPLSHIVNAKWNQIK